MDNPTKFSTKYPNFFKVIYISIVLFLFQGIANSLMGILSQITHQNNRDWAGPISTLLLFLCSGIGALYNKYVNVCRFGFIMYLASLGYTFYVGSSIVFILIGESQNIWILVAVFILTAASGFIVSGLYNSQFNYINQCANLDNTSIYFGINLAIVQASNIGGNLLSTFTVQLLGQLHYCIMMTILISAIALGFIFIRELQKRNIPLQKSSQLITEGLAQINQEEKKIKERFKNSVYHMVPSFFMSGVIISFIYCYISIIMYKTFFDKQKQQLNRLTFAIFIFEGIGELIGGCLVIYGADRFNKCKQILVLNNLFMISIVLCYIGYMNQNIYLIGFTCIIVGICDCGIFSLDLAVTGEQKWDTFGYSVFNFSQCFGVTVSILVILFTNLEFFFAYMIGCQIISSIALHNFDK